VSDAVREREWKPIAMVKLSVKISLPVAECFFLLLFIVLGYIVAFTKVLTIYQIIHT
jgi:hypothetical protein